MMAMLIQVESRRKRSAGVARLNWWWRASIITVLGWIILGGEVQATETALPRITVRNGRFVETASGTPMTPFGFNYVRVAGRAHVLFAPNRYNPRGVERMMSILENNEFNIVRVFITPHPPNGIISSLDANDFSNEYMANVIDFLRRARRHHIYVIPTMAAFPRIGRYFPESTDASDVAAMGNRFYLDENWINAKAAYLKDFINEIKRFDPQLLSTVFAYELENEVSFQANRKPFGDENGEAESASGTTYDLSSDIQAQKLADEAAVYWADRCVEAIHEVDSGALVSVSVFTFRAVGRHGPARLGRDVTNDHRFPARPLALVASSIDYLDVHLYPHKNRSLRADLSSIEFKPLVEACRRTGKPLIVGEFGAYIKDYPTLRRATRAMPKFVRKLRRRGFGGFIFWTYDTVEQDRLWTAMSGGGRLMSALRNAAAKLDL